MKAPRTPTPPLASRRRVKRQHWPRQHPGTPPPTPQRKRKSKSESAFTTPDYKTFEISLTPISSSPISEVCQDSSPTMRFSAHQLYPGWSPSAEKINKPSGTYLTPVSPSPSKMASQNLSAGVINTRLLFPERSPSVRLSSTKRRIEKVDDLDLWELPLSPHRKKLNVTRSRESEKDEWHIM